LCGGRLCCCNQSRGNNTSFQQKSFSAFAIIIPYSSAEIPFCVCFADRDVQVPQTGMSALERLLLFLARQRKQQHRRHHHHHRHQMNQSSRIACLIHGFGGEGCEEVNGILAKVHNKEECSTEEKRRLEGILPSCNEKSNKECRQQEPVSFKERINPDCFQYSSFSRLPTRMMSSRTGICEGKYSMKRKNCSSTQKILNRLEASIPTHRLLPSSKPRSLHLLENGMSLS